MWNRDERIRPPVPFKQRASEPPGESEQSREIAREIQRAKRELEDQYASLEAMGIAIRVREQSELGENDRHGQRRPS